MRIEKKADHFGEGWGLANLIIMNRELETFFNQANGILESDYGDYMRQANFHLNNLRDEAERLPYLDVLNQIILTQYHLLYQSTGRINLTHVRLIHDVEVASQLYEAHQQDWESKAIQFSLV
jgi:hypothetical protein